MEHQSSKEVTEDKEDTENTEDNRGKCEEPNISKGSEATTRRTRRTAELMGDACYDGERKSDDMISFASVSDTMP